MWWQQYIGVPFEFRGRGPDTFDCWGIVRYVYRFDHPKKISLPSYAKIYMTSKDVKNIPEIMFGEIDRRWKEVDTPQEYDVILLRMRGFPMHVGIVTKKGYMVHCACGMGTVHEKFDSLRWRNKVLGFYRYE